MGLRIKSRSLAAVRPMVTVMMMFALVAQPMYGFVASQIANAAPDTTYASTGFGSLSWAVDRKAPADHSITGDSFSMTIDSAAAGATDYVKQEGYSANIGPSITSIKADLFIDPSWEGKTVTTSLWGATVSPSAWPRVEFTNKDGTPHITSMRSLGGEPVHNGSVPVTYGSTVTVEVAIDPVAKGFVFYANDAEFYRYDSTDYPASWNYERYFTTFNKVFVKAWNTGVDGDNYTATWSNLELGTKQTATPEGINLRVDGNAVASGFVTNSRTAQLHWDPVSNTERYEVAIKRPGAENFETHYANTTPRNLLVDRDYFGNTDGTYEYKVRAKSDTTGQWSSWTDTVQLSYDTTAPVIDPITANGFDFATDGTAVVSGINGIEFKFTITDELAGHDYTYAEVKKANGEWVQGTEGLHLRGNSPVWTIPADRATEGNYVLKLSSRDKLGNSQSTLYAFRIDNSTPAFDLKDGQSPRQVIESDSYLNLSRLNSDSAELNAVHFSGKQSTDRLYVNDELAHNHGYFERSNSGKIGNLFTEDGVYTVHTVNALGAASATVTFTVDTIGPVINTPEVADYLRGEQTFEITQEEVNSDRAYVEYMQKDANGNYKKVDGEWINDTNDLSYTVDTAKWADGEYQVKISTWDKANNHTSAAFQFSVDNTAPTIGGFEFENIKNGKYNPTKVIARVAEDDGSRSAEVYLNVYKKDENGDWKRQAGVFTQGGPNGRDFVELAATDSRYKTDGVYRLEAWAKDQAGNVGDKKVSREFTVDKADPETTIEVSKNNQGFVGKTFTVSGEAKDNDALNRVYVQLIHRESNTRYGGTTVNLIPYGAGPHEWSVEYDAAELNLPEGTYAAHVSVVDRAGNSTASGWTDNFTLDTIAPEVQISNMAAVNPTSFSIEASDGVQLNRIDYSLYTDDNTTRVGGWGQWISGTEFREEGISHYANNPTQLFTDLESGTYTLRATVSDAAGNPRNASSVNFTVERTEESVTPAAPTITGADAQSVQGTAEAGATVAVFVNGTPRGTTTANASGNWTLPFAPALPAGTHVITAQVIDGDMKSALASFPQITVLAIDGVQGNIPSGVSDSPAGGVETISSSGPSIPGSVTPLGAASASAFTFPAMLAGPVTDSAVLGDQDVLGTTDTAAPSATANDEADDAEESNGLAWYWWLIIAAAGVGAFWWIIAAVRKSNDEE